MDGALTLNGILIRAEKYKCMFICITFEGNDRSCSLKKHNLRLS